MKRYGILIFITAAAAAVLLLVYGYLPVAVQTVTAAAQTAVKTELCSARVTDTTHLQVFLREGLSSTVTKGQAVTVTGTGFREDSYRGTVTAVADEATLQNGKTVVPAVVTLEAGDDSVKKGLSATVRIAVATYENAVVVKDEWLHTDAEGTFLWVLENGCARRQEVLLGDRTDGGTLAKNLAAGTRLILSPDTLRNGQRVCEEAAE